MIVSRGTPVKGVFPHNNLFINKNKIGAFYSVETYGNHAFFYDLKQDTSVTIKIDMDNDAIINNEDRNTFIHKIYIIRQKE